ncbi:MAG: phenylalanine--tRNA ligase subunit beta [Firmicutes bacterium]|nr:phenylalanine--tRNA ligase subunit beta [Bacillota bacterium]
MLVPLRWLSDYVDINLDTEELADRLTMSGTKVETINTVGDRLRHVVAGRIISVDPHESADRLRVVRVDLGSRQVPRTLVTAAANVSKGDLVPAVLAGGAIADGTEIGEADFSGVKSEGMLCSAKELGISPDGSGILHLPEEINPGDDVVAALGLADTVIEFEITPNRPDCLCMIGIAREVAAITGETLRMPQTSLEEGGERADQLIRVNIDAHDLCLRYGARVMQQVRIAPSPIWMQARLSAAGVRPINNVVDVTNYVMLELNQPLHAFDYDRMSEHEIIVRRAYPGETIVTLDGEERELDADMLVIADPGSALAVAGVMGGLSTEIEEDTCNVLLESANFAHQSVWRTSRSLRLRTEASSRFEKGLDPETVPVALDRAGHLLEAVGAGVAGSGIVDAYPSAATPRIITTDAARISRRLGVSVSAEDVADCLDRLGFSVCFGDGKDKGEPKADSLVVEVPTFRDDVAEEIDLVEEVARMWGYDRIPMTVPAGAHSGGYTYEQKKAMQARTLLAGAGASEAITVPFMSPGDFDMLRIAQGDPRRDAIRISNPMVEEQSYLRTTMMPSLLSTIRTNINRGNKGVCLFELGKTYFTSDKLKDGRKLGRGEDPAVERMVLACGMAGAYMSRIWHTRERSYDFYDAKGMLEALFEGMSVNGVDYVQTVRPSFHPGRTASVVRGGREIGVVGEVHPDVAASYGVADRTYMFELDFAELLQAADGAKSYEPLPRHPAVERDVAMILPLTVPVARVAELIQETGGELVRSVTLFDVYEGSPVPEGKRSIAFSVTYRANDRTLTDEEVNSVHSAIRQALEDKLGATLR